MKKVFLTGIFAALFLLNGCYTIVSLEEEPEISYDEETLSDNTNQNYFDEENYNEEIETSYASNDQYNVANGEPGFWEILFTEIFIGFSDAAYSEDLLNIITDINYSSSSDEDSSKERENSTTRNSGGRNYNSRR